MPKKILFRFDYAPEFRVMAIFSAQKDYRLCWLLNQTLGVELARMPDFLYPPAGGGEALPFSFFRYSEPAMKRHFLLLAGKSQGQPLFAQPRNIDYLLLYKIPSGQYDYDQDLNLIRSIAQVQTALFVDGKLEKNAHSFFYDLEMFCQANTIQP